MLNANIPTPESCILSTNVLRVADFTALDWPDATGDYALLINYAGDGVEWVPLDDELFAYDTGRDVAAPGALTTNSLLRYQTGYAYHGSGDCEWGAFFVSFSSPLAGHHFEYAWSGDGGTGSSDGVGLTVPPPTTATRSVTVVVSLVRNIDSVTICSRSFSRSESLECPFGWHTGGDTNEWGAEDSPAASCEGEPPADCTPPAPVACFDSLETIALDAVATIDFPVCTTNLKFQTKTGAGAWTDAQTGIVADVEYSVAATIAAGMKGRFVADDGTAGAEIDLLICPIEPTISLRRVIRVEQPELWPEGVACLSPEYRWKSRTEEGAEWSAWITARDSGGGKALLRETCGAISFDVYGCHTPPYADLEVRLVESDCSGECGGSFALTTISDSEDVVGLGVGEEDIITVDHSADADFAFCEHPRLTVPEGVIVTVLAARENADATNGAQFILKVENESHTVESYGSPGDIVIAWTRTGVLA